MVLGRKMTAICGGSGNHAHHCSFAHQCHAQKVTHKNEYARMDPIDSRTQLS
jgi:hypothetical protein